jgi:hypothetical protein
MTRTHRHTATEVLVLARTEMFRQRLARYHSLGRFALPPEPTS